MDSDARVLVLDVTDIFLLPRGQKVINALLSSKGKLFQTARGRVAVQIAPLTFDRIKGQLKIQLEDGFDGTKAVSLIADVVKPVAPVSSDPLHLDGADTPLAA